MAKTRSMSRRLNHYRDASSSSSSSSSSQKMFKTFDNSGVGPWSDINHDVLILVMMQLGVVDFVSFSGVCKSWRSLALSYRNRFMASIPPMRMWTTSTDNEKDDYYHLEDIEERNFKTILPHSAGRKCVGLTGGYVVLFGRETRDFWLVNPITRHELHFPNYPLYVSVEAREIKAILVFSPLIPACMFVLLHRKLSYSIAGKRGWNHVSSTPRIVDIHVFKGKIFTLHTDCSLSELRLDPQKRKWMLLETKNLPHPYLFSPQLVSSSENLYVMTYSGVRPTKVLELDFGEMKWVSPGKTIGEYAFFVSYLEYSAAFKPEPWTDPRRQRRSYEYFLDDDKSRKCMFFYQEIWYFPHECLNVNLLDE